MALTSCQITWANYLTSVIIAQCFQKLPSSVTQTQLIALFWLIDPRQWHLLQITLFRL